MWRYEKRLQYPVKISQTNPKLAQFIISQYGGPDGESAASMRYLSQRYAMPYEKGKAILTDIGTLRRSKNLGLVPIISITLLASGRRQQEEFPLMPVNSNPKAIRSRIFLRI